MRKQFSGKQKKTKTHRSTQKEDEHDEDDEDYDDRYEEDEEDNDNDEDVVELELEDIIKDSSSSTDEEPDDDDDDDPGRVMDRIVDRQNASRATILTTKQKNTESSSSLAIEKIGDGDRLALQNAATTDAASNYNLDGYVRGMSRSESLRNRQNHVALRVRMYVKSTIFRKIKFINSDAMFQRAMTLVMDNEAVPSQMRGKFQMLYESVFNESLNTKRSSCEQTGGKIVREAIARFKEKGESDFFTIEELCTLRQATTDRERSAFFWFFGSFIECVCGRRSWGKQKHYQLISGAEEDNGIGKLVTRSDEAFALLIFENYIDKWKSAMIPVNEDQKQNRQRGKFTAKKSGHCKYGGWSREGTARFNELYKIVQADRACPQSEAMEMELLAFCRKEKWQGKEQEEEDKSYSAATMVVEPEALPVEATWDLDD